MEFSQSECVNTFLAFLQKLLELDTVKEKKNLIVNMSNQATQNLPSNTKDMQQQA